MQFIQFSEMENLLKNYRRLKGLTQSIRLEIKQIQEITEDGVTDFIEVQAFKKRQLDDVQTQFTGYVTDKTGKTAITYKEKMEKENNRILKQLKEDLILLEVIISKLDIAYKALPEEPQKIIKLRYWDELTWYQIEDRLLLTKYQANDRKNQALKTMATVARIRTKQYEEITKLLNLK